MKRQQYYFLALAILFSSCATSYLPTGSTTNDLQILKSAEDQETVERKVIHTASMLMAVEELDSSAIHLSRIVSNLGGTLFSREGYAFEFRVLPSKLEGTMQGVSLLGVVKERSVSSLDVTDQFYDDKIRLNNAKATHARYLALLDKANTIDEILKIEKELERLSQQIDLIQGRVNRIQDKSALATLKVQLKQKTKPGIFGHIGVGLYKGTKWLFVKD